MFVRKAFTAERAERESESSSLISTIHLARSFWNESSLPNSDPMSTRNQSLLGTKASEERALAEPLGPLEHERVVDLAPGLKRAGDRGDHPHRAHGARVRLLGGAAVVRQPGVEPRLAVPFEGLEVVDAGRSQDGGASGC